MSLTRTRVQDTLTRLRNDLKASEAAAALPDASPIEKALPEMLRRQVELYEALLRTFDEPEPT